MSKVLFWTAGDDGASWYRADQPAQALIWSGHSVAVTQEVTREMVMEADVVVGSRIANEGAAEFWCELAALPAGQRPKLVLDLDDAYFALDPRNPASGQWDAAQLGRLRQTIQTADLVTVVSEALAQHVIVAAAPDPGRVRVVPNGLHAGWLGTPRDYDKAGPEPITVGWSGTASSARDLDLVTKALANIVNYGAGQVRLLLVGVPRLHPALARLRVGIERRFHHMVDGVEWVQHGQPYLSACAQFDIWVAPYRGDEFVQCKFPTKALEAGFLGVPLIASDVRPYREWDDSEESGVALVSELRPHMWGRYLKTLVDSASTRRAMGEAGRSRAAHNIMQAVGQQWSNTLGLES